jgi:hypothetical protein
MLLIASRNHHAVQIAGDTPMANRLAAILLAAVFAASLTGCARDPFACCDQRKSLADWFDWYGPTGCECADGSSRHR